MPFEPGGLLGWIHENHNAQSGACVNVNERILSVLARMATTEGGPIASVSGQLRMPLLERPVLPPEFAPSATRPAKFEASTLASSLGAAVQAGPLVSRRSL
jgi:hypothetical protein